MKKHNTLIRLVSAISLLALPLMVFAVVDRDLPNRPSRERAPRIENEIIIKHTGSDKFRRVRLPAGVSVESAIGQYRSLSDVEYAEPKVDPPCPSMPR